MLHKETVEPKTFALLEKIQAIPELADFHLVGGTSLALQFGHRKSIDLNLFGPHLDKKNVLNKLKKEFKDEFSFIQEPSEWSLFCFIENIKVDIIQFEHPLLFPVHYLENVRLIDPRDIAAMKINAVLNRGTKKDFWDIHELLNHLSLEEIINFFNRKYPDQRLMISVPQALVYFEDAESDPDPICLRHNTWEKIKSRIRSEVNSYLS